MKKSMKKLPLWCEALLICCVLTFLGMPKEVRAADGTLNLNETKNITIEDFAKESMHSGCQIPETLQLP